MVQLTELQLLNNLFDRLFPLCRSITGPGYRQSLDILQEYLPFKRHIFLSGKRVFDWTVPNEWEITSAQLIGPDNIVYADFAKTNLSVVNYSEPVDEQKDLEALRPHLHTISDLPDAIPYVTSYYLRNWGFCLPFSVYKSLPPGQYHAKIESRFYPGSIVVGDCILPGETQREILLTSYLCHPSLANNELSGPLVLLGLYRRLAQWPRRRYTYRFVIHPETIGSICYLSRFHQQLKRHVQSGLVLTCLGGSQPKLSYKTSRSQTSLMDKVVLALHQQGDFPVDIRPFDPTSGSDERQYCSPGINLPMGQMARTVYGNYDGYHNSLDTKATMTIESLVESIGHIETLLRIHELAGPYVNLSPFGEPQLSKRELYPHINSHNTRNYSSDMLEDQRTFLNRILTVLSYADGQNTMLDIAEKCQCTLVALQPVIEHLETLKLLALFPNKLPIAPLEETLS